MTEDEQATVTRDLIAAHLGVAAEAAAAVGVNKHRFITQLAAFGIGVYIKNARNENVNEATIRKEMNEAIETAFRMHGKAPR